MSVFSTPPHSYRQHADKTSLSHFFYCTFCYILLLTLMNNTYAGEPFKIAKIKAAYVYQFASYTSWPENKLSHNKKNSDKEIFSICYSGQGTNFIKALKQLADKKHQQHTIQIKQFKPDIKNNCHVLVMTHIDNNYTEHLKTISTQPVLTISDIPEFADSEHAVNGNIELFKKSNKVRFIINRKSVLKSQLKISSKLLKLAIIVD